LRAVKVLDQLRERIRLLHYSRRTEEAYVFPALSALLFLYGKVLGQDLPWMSEIGRPVPHPRLPVVLSPAEVAAVLAQFPEGEHALLARLLYGTGLRITEALQLRVKDVDFAWRAAVFLRQATAFL
jgi:integrase